MEGLTQLLLLELNKYLPQTSSIILNLQREKSKYWFLNLDLVNSKSKLMNNSFGLRSSSFSKMEKPRITPQSSIQHRKQMKIFDKMNIKLKISNVLGSDKLWKVRL